MGSPVRSRYYAWLAKN